MKKIAIILFNLGGPNNQKAVQPFLFNLFNDPAIIGLPQPFRYLIAKLISKRRAPIAYEIYGKMNGGSPILKNTRAQAQALEDELNQGSSDQAYKCFIAMRYWHPFADEAIQDIQNYAPDEIVLLPLYPQFSTTTTGSSLKEWHELTAKNNISLPTKTICCYPQEPGFIRPLADATRKAYEQAKQGGTPRILFSAHGLPEKIVLKGDPYQRQCEITVEALQKELSIEGLDSLLCFQSRVGPLKWIGPATDDEVRRAGRDKVPLVVVPVAFVSDHSETLVELDIEYRHLANESGVPFYAVVPAVGTTPDFIRGLAKVVHDSQGRKRDCVSSTGARLCSLEFTGCICKQD